MTEGCSEAGAISSHFQAYSVIYEMRGYEDKGGKQSKHIDGFLALFTAS